MSFSARHVPAVLLAFFSLAVTLCAQSTLRQSSKTPRGTVSGRVTIKDKGAAGVAVGLRKSDRANPFEPFLKATTDQDGFYRITDVSPGSYEILLSAPAFVIADNNNAKTKNVVVGEDENIEGINFSLVRGGVITGKVTDAEGRPVIQQQVSIYRTEVFEQQAQQRPFVPAGNVQTDDRGVYRIFGVSAGRYKVGTGRGDDTFGVQFSLTMRPGYKQVFHPDVTDQIKATIIEVTEGSETKNVDITLGRALQTFSVTGRVVDGEKGLPMPNIRFGLQRSVGQRVEFVGSLAVSDGQGDFIVEGLIPGKYGIYLFPTPNAEIRAETLSFDIIDQDVSGVIVKLTKGASLSGVVVLDSEDKTALKTLLQMQLRAFVMATSGGGGFGQSASSPISPDGSFRLAGLPAGTATIFLSSALGMMGAKGLIISRIERDGIAQRGIEIKDGEQVVGLRVIVSYGNGTLRGVVKFENGSPPPEAQILARLTKPGENFSGLQPAQVDARGQFLMEDIPPGVYELNVWISTGSATPLRNVKRDVSVQDGVVTQVMITIDMDVIRKP